MDIRIIDPCLCPQWNKLILDNFDPDIFHSVEWCQVLKSAYKFKPAYFLATENEQPAALIPLIKVKSLITGSRAVSLPFSDYCNFLGNDPGDLKLLIEQIKGYGWREDWKYVEFRSRDFIEEADPSEIFFTHDLDLTNSSSALWSGLKDSCRRNIKKATREGLKVKFDKSWSSLEQFYRFQVITRKRHGLPPQPLKFFKSIYESIISRDFGIVVSAYYQNKPIAASVYFHFNQKGLFKYGASDPKFHHLRPNNLIMWEAIDWHRENGCSTFNLGRTDPGDEGLLNYKRLWGSKETQLKYYRYCFKKNGYIHSASKSFNSTVTSLAKFLPSFLLEVIGRIAYRHIG